MKKQVESTGYDFFVRRFVREEIEFENLSSVLELALAQNTLRMSKRSAEGCCTCENKSRL